MYPARTQHALSQTWRTGGASSLFLTALYKLLYAFLCLRHHLPPWHASSHAKQVTCFSDFGVFCGRDPRSSLPALALGMMQGSSAASKTKSPSSDLCGDLDAARVPGVLLG